MIQTKVNKLGLNASTALDCSFSVVDATIQTPTYLCPDRVLIDGVEVAFTYSNNKVGIGTISTARTFTLEIQKTGYITYTQSYTYVTLNNASIGISPEQQETAIRIVLTWGATPKDLDSYCYILNNGTQIGRTYYSAKTFTDANTSVTLDKDCTSGYGPETTTIDPFYDPYTYSFKVQDFTNRSTASSVAMSNSGAKVEIYKGNTLAHTVNIPTNVAGYWWTVFEYHNGTFTIINTVGTS